MTEPKTAFMSIKINTRWPIRQVGDSTILVDVPLGGTHMVAGEWIQQMCLTDREVDMIEAECQQLAIKRLLLLD